MLTQMLSRVIHSFLHKKGKVWKKVRDGTMIRNRSVEKRIRLGLRVKRSYANQTRRMPVIECIASCLMHGCNYTTK